ncbi:MAG TPA: response regulator [Elusimicrobia bacterium]|nr:response regulator [Elusimicrobiota bacterium]
MTGSERHILIVDDEQGFHDLFRFILEPLGFTISSAYNGLEGLERLKERDYDIVFLDVHMPKMTGTELLKLLREIKPLQLVVVMSSGSDPQQAFEKTARDMGAISCMFKPFELEQIMKNITHINGA